LTLPFWVYLGEDQKYDLEAFINRVAVCLAWWAGRIANEQARELLDLDPEANVYDFMEEHADLALGVVNEYKVRRTLGAEHQQESKSA
jgi:hypothetical protein